MTEPAGTRIRHERIEMADGVRLAATLYVPEGEGPWPVVLEALPYRKDDITAVAREEYLRIAEHGYVVCRLDVRGTGSSEGIARDEYTPEERADLVAVIEWLATRRWSTGAVGMYGMSYSGFNSLQAAMERPPALKAIVSIFASDDRYGDDVHYFGGALKALDLVDYPTYMVAMNALPPVPERYGEGWREEWARRVEGAEPWVLHWLAHQRRDDYWAYGSLAPDYARISAATMLIAGWADGYTNVALRGFEGLTCPKRLLIGPWPHAALETCLPGPNIDMVHELVRWFDRWLKDRDDGIGSEPPIVVYAQRSTAPSPIRPEVRGEWRFEPTWPPARGRAMPLGLGDAEPGGLARPGAPDVLDVRGDTGWTAWISCAGVMPWTQSSDQRPDEERSLTSTWPPLDEELEILGHPVLRLRLTSSAPVAYVSAKLCDVFPDGSSSLVTRGLLNLAHRDSRESPTPVPIDTEIDVEIPLEVCSWTFERGHRLRLDLAGSDWPNAWPPPAPVRLTVDRAASTLTLPVLDGPPPVSTTPSVRPSPFPQDDPLASSEREWARWDVHEDPDAIERVAVAEYGGTTPAADGAPERSERYGGTVAASTVDPGGARADGEARLELRFPEATCTAISRLHVESDREVYRVHLVLRVLEDGEERWGREWERTVPRDLQ